MASLRRVLILALATGALSSPVKNVAEDASAEQHTHKPILPPAEDDLRHSLQHAPADMVVAPVEPPKFPIEAPSSVSGYPRLEVDRAREHDIFPVPTDPSPVKRDVEKKKKHKHKHKHKHQECEADPETGDIPLYDPKTGEQCRELPPRPSRDPNAPMSCRNCRLGPLWESDEDYKTGVKNCLAHCTMDVAPSATPAPAAPIPAVSEEEKIVPSDNALPKSRRAPHSPPPVGYIHTYPKQLPDPLHKGIPEFPPNPKFTDDREFPSKFETYEVTDKGVRVTTYLYGQSMGGRFLNKSEADRYLRAHGLEPQHKDGSS